MSDTAKHELFTPWKQSLTRPVYAVNSEGEPMLRADVKNGDRSAAGELLRETIERVNQHDRLTRDRDALLAAARGLDDFAWTAVNADCEEARVYLNGKIEALRSAIRAAEEPQ